MPKITYETVNMRGPAMELVALCNTIIRDYQLQGFTLTLRQLYYQLVARDHLANKQTEYKRLGKIVAKARRGGLMDWAAIEDRTRELRGIQHWSSPEEIVRAAMRGYAIDKWRGQPYRPEVWIEKDALLNVVAQACRPLDVDYFSCRGYASDSELWRAGHHRMRPRLSNGQIPVIIHLADHDPSGIDMSRDLADRLAMYSGNPVEVRRVALNMDQVEQYNPPPNPAKFTDSRASQYVQIHGTSSWELDALEPEVMVGIIQRAIRAVRDERIWLEAVAEEEEHKARLREMIGDG